MDLLYFDTSLLGSHPDCMMYINIYAGDLPTRKTCNFDTSINKILIGLDGCIYIILPSKQLITTDFGADN